MTNEQANEDKTSKKELTIFVNSRAKKVTTKELTFEEIVELSFPGQPETERLKYTITYTRGQGNKPEGSLTAGNSVKIKDGMRFNVTQTDKS